MSYCSARRVIILAWDGIPVSRYGQSKLTPRRKLRTKLLYRQKASYTSARTPRKSPMHGLEKVMLASGLTTTASAHTPELNRATTPGRFLLAGSTRYEALPKGAQLLTGRLTRVAIQSCTQAEIDGVNNFFRPRMFEHTESLVTAAISSTIRVQDIQRIVRGPPPWGKLSSVARMRVSDDTIRAHVIPATFRRAAARPSGGGSTSAAIGNIAKVYAFVLNRFTR